MKRTILLIGIAAGFASIATAKDVPPGEIDGLVTSGKIMSKQKLDEIALQKHPGARIEDGEVELHRSGYVYEVEVVDEQGNEWDMDIDAKTGKVLRSEKD